MFILFFIFLNLPHSFASIPEYSTILRRWVDANPKTAFGVEWAVTFKEGNKTYTAEEAWWFKNETDAEVIITGTGNLTNLLNLSISYDNTKRFSEGLSSTLSQEMLDFISAQKNLNVLRNRLVQQGLATQDSLRDRPSIKPGQEDKYKAPPFLELVRARSQAAYWLKGPSSAGVAIEQDKFVPRKFVFASGSQVFFDDYTKIGETFWFPKKKTFRWSQGEVEMVMKRFLTKKTTDKPTTSVAKTTDVPLIQDFYRRFR